MTLQNPSAQSKSLEEPGLLATYFQRHYHVQNQRLLELRSSRPDDLGINSVLQHHQSDAGQNLVDIPVGTYTRAPRMRLPDRYISSKASGAILSHRPTDDMPRTGCCNAHRAVVMTRKIDMPSATTSCYEHGF